MILVAGGAGQLGTKVVGLLRRRRLEVRVLTRRSRAAHLIDAGVEIVEGDVSDPSAVRRAIDGADSVVSAIHGFAGPNNNGSPASLTVMATAASPGPRARRESSTSSWSWSWTRPLITPGS